MACFERALEEFVGCRRMYRRGCCRRRVRDRRRWNIKACSGSAVRDEGYIGHRALGVRFVKKIDGVGVDARGIAFLGVLSIKQQLRTKITGRGSVNRAF